MTEDEETLIRQAQAGNGQAVRALTQANLPRVYGLAYRMLGNAADAEDAAQDAFVRLWKVLPEWRFGQAKLSTWLYRVTTNLCIDRSRKRREAPMPEGFDMADDSRSAHENMESAERGEAVRRAIAGLPERQKGAIVLVHFEGLSGQEAASALGTSVEALESLLARGRRTLRAQLEAVGVEEGLT